MQSRRTNSLGTGGDVRNPLVAATFACLASLTSLGGIAAERVLPAGNLATASPQINQQLAQDAVSQLGVVYALATRFALIRPATDPFGALFVAGLRNKGYTLVPSAAARDDQPAAGVYRVSLSVAGKTLTRTYVKQGAAAAGAGGWTDDAVPNAPTTAMRAPLPAPATTPGDSGRAPFAVTSSDTLLVPLLVRWAQSDGLIPLLNGRRVTTRTLSEEAYSDLPLTPQARAVTGATAAQAITKILETYSRYRVNLEVEATVKSSNFLAITTRKTAASPVTPAAPLMPVASASPLPPTSAPKVERFAPVPPAPPAPPAPSIESTASVTHEKSWDAPARKAAGVLRGNWDVGSSRSLRAVVEAWATQSGYRIDWTSKQDPRVTDALRAATYTGTFKEALMQLAGDLGELKVPIGMTFDPTNGALVLRVFDM